ncbi:hypothetical protein D3C73_828430 [compost metagenome]
MVQQLGEPGSQPLAQHIGALHQVLLLQDFQIAQGKRTGRGVAAEGIHMAEMPVIVTVVLEGIVDILADRRCRQRQVGAGQSFGHGDDIRLHTKIMMAEFAAGTPEAANDLVNNQQHTVLAANFLYPVQIDLMGHNDTAAGNHRLHNDRRYRLHAFPDHRILYRLRTLKVEFLHGHAGWTAVAVRRGHMQKSAAQRLVFIFPLCLAGSRERAKRAAMIAPVAGDEFVTVMLAYLLLVLAGYFEGSFVGF